MSGQDPCDQRSTDERLVEALLEANFAAEPDGRHLDALVQNVLSELEPASASAVRQRGRRWLPRISTLVVGLLLCVGLGWILSGTPQTAQAAVLETLEKTLAAGPRRYHAEFTYQGPVRGTFRSEGACYLDGSRRFVLEIPSPLGFPNRLWRLGSDGRQLWAVMPTGEVWLDPANRLDVWWDDRGAGKDMPILHLEAILKSLGENYELTIRHNEQGQQVISGVATAASPDNWSDEIELVIDANSGFARDVRLTWQAGRVREIKLRWDESAQVSPDFFDAVTTDSPIERG